MKKILLVAIMFVAANAFAGIDGGLEPGMTKVGLYGGFSMPVSDWSADLSSAGMGAVDYKPGDTGYIFGAEIIRNFVPMFAIGLDVGYMNHGDKQVVSNPDVDTNTNILSAHIMGRINFFAEQSTRLYIPFGAGISKFDMEVSSAAGTESHDETGLSFVGGLGVEFDLSPVWTMGIEGRYFYMPLDDYADNDYFDSFNIMLKLGARF